MRYLTADELKVTHRDHAREILGGEFAGKSVRDQFAMRVFNAYHDRCFAGRSRTRILDLGAASAAFARQLAESGYRDLSGTDIDDYRSPASRRLFRDFRVVDLSAERLPWPDQSFDAVTAWCVLPHLENPFQAVREVGRVLCSGGLFVFTVLHLGSKPSRAYFLRHGDFKSYRATNNHIALFTPGVIAKTILRSFELVGTEYHFRPKIFRGPKGRVRELAYRLSAFRPAWQRALEYRWAYDVAYIVQKPL